MVLSWMLSRDYKFVQFAVFTHNIWAVDSVCNIYVYIYIMCFGLLSGKISKWYNECLIRKQRRSISVYQDSNLAVIWDHCLFAYRHIFIHKRYHPRLYEPKNWCVIYAQYGCIMSPKIWNWLWNICV